MSVQVKRRQFTIDEVQQMLRVGIVQADERIELIDGEILALAAMGGEHFESVMLCNDVLNAIPEKHWFVSVQSAIQLTAIRVPQPDIALIRRRAYDGALPGPEDVFLLIEVSDSTLNYDRKTKVPLYAEAGIPEVWIVALKQRRITRYSEPHNGRYTLVQAFQRDETITSLVLPAIHISVQSILPRTGKKP